MQTEQPVQPTYNIPLPPAFKSPAFLGLCAFLGILLLYSAIANNVGAKPKAKVATTGRWAGRKEKANARQTAIKQIKARKYDQVALTIGNLASKFIPFCNANPGNLILGRPGTGKSYGCFEPLFRSSAEQGLPMIIYDPAGDHAKNLSGYAASLGYEIYHFFPGNPRSDALNLLDFLKDDSDSEMAEALGYALMQSLNKTGMKADAFFGPAAEKLGKAACLIAKGSIYADLAMVFKILSLDDLPLRIAATSNVWARNAASTTIASKDAAKTTGGIIGSAQNPIESLMTARNLEVMLGKSSIPLDIRGKKIVFLSYDEQMDRACAPIIATAIHLFVQRNIGNHIPEHERSPLVLGLDEFSSGENFLLPAIPSWLARYRKFGLVCLCGVHNYSQLTDAYGRDKARKIIEAFGNKIFFNPNGETADDLMKELGDQEVLTRTVSVGTKGARNVSYQRDKMPLLSADKIRKMPKRSAILISQDVEGKFKGEKEASVPWKINKLSIPQSDRQIQENSVKWWKEKGEARFIERAQARFQWTQAELEKSLIQRELAAQKLLPKPMPEKLENKFASGKSGKSGKSLVKQLIEQS